MLKKDITPGEIYAMRPTKGSPTRRLTEVVVLSLDRWRRDKRGRLRPDRRGVGELYPAAMREPGEETWSPALVSLSRILGPFDENQKMIRRAAQLREKTLRETQLAVFENEEISTDLAEALDGHLRAFGGDGGEDLDVVNRATSRRAQLLISMRPEVAVAWAEALRIQVEDLRTRIEDEEMAPAHP